MGIQLKFSNKRVALGTVIKMWLVLFCISTYAQPSVAQEPVNSPELEAQQAWQIAQEQFKRDGFKACFQSLQSLSRAFSGKIAFDRLWGLCAHGSGEYNLALLAYNRILWQQNMNAEIRLEHARVLYDLGLYQKSREEFQWLLSKNPPQNARVIIVNYLQAIKVKLPKVKQSTRVKVSTAIGHDDNVNAAPLLEEFLGFSIDPNSQALESPYMALQGSLSHMFVITPNSGLKLNTGLSTKNFPDAGAFDQGLAMLGLGYQQLYERSAFGVDAVAYGLSVDSALNAKGLISNTHYTYQLNPQLILTPYVGLGVLRFSDEVLVKNVNQYSLGSKLKYKVDSAERHTLALDYSFGHDNPINPDSNYELNFHKLDIRYLLNFSDSIKVTTGLGYDLFDFDEAFFPLDFPEPRKDDSWTWTSGLDWAMNERWTISPLLSYRNFESNVDIYTHERAFAELNVSYQWSW